MNIDWSKAPEGTTHYHPMVDGYVPHWLKIKGDKSWFCVTDFEKEGWKQDFGKPNLTALVEIPTEVAEQNTSALKTRAVDEIVRDLDVPRAIAARAYDLGYRKFEIVEEDVCPILC